MTTTRCHISRVLGALTLVALAVGILPAAALAKQVHSVVVCGVSECRSLDGNQRFLNLFNVYLPPSHRPDRDERARWFVVRVTIVVPGTRLAPETWHTRFYPEAAVTHDRADGWRAIPTTSLSAYQQAVDGIVPFGAPSDAAAPPHRRHVAPTAGEDRTDVSLLAVVTLGSSALVCLLVGSWRLRRRHRLAGRLRRPFINS